MIAKNNYLTNKWKTPTSLTNERRVSEWLFLHIYLFLLNFDTDDVVLFNINYFFSSKGLLLKISGDKDAIDLGYIFIFNHDIKKGKKMYLFVI